MRPSTGLFALAFGVVIATPAGAQTTTTSTTNDHYMSDITHAVMSKSRWNLSANLATNQFGTFMLQDSPGGERALRGSRNMGFGLGAGFDMTDQLGVRLGYTYTGTNMEFRDYSGTGSNLLDIDEIGKLKSNIASLDVVHYFVGSRSMVSPYAGAGIAGVWSSLGPQNGTLLSTPGGSQQFHMGIDANLGVQVRVIPQLFGRLEWATMGTHNPFSGNRGYRANGGNTITEYERVSKSEWRLGASYYLGKLPPSQQPTVATSP